MKILRDTLKNPQTGRYSRKSLTGLLCFSIATIMTVASYVTGEVNMELVKVWLHIGEITLGITVVDKAIGRHTASHVKDKKLEE